MVGFQNCGSPMQFQEAVAQDSLSSGGEVLDPVSAVNDPVVDNGNGDGIETTMPVPDEPEGQEPLDPPVPGEDGGDNPPTETVDPFSCAGLSDAAPANTNECKAAMAQASKYLTLEDGASIKNFAGNFTAKSGHVVTIENTKGNLILVGIGAAYVESINNTKGNLTICNMDVGAVESVSAGNITIDGGNVCRVVGHKGNVKINNGSVGEVNYNKGNISVSNGNVGSINAHTGNILIKNGTVTGTITNSVGNIKISN